MPASRRLLVSFLALLLAGCAGAPPAPDARVKTDVRGNAYANMTIDGSPGRFQRFDAALNYENGEASANLSAVVQMLKLQASNEWWPTISFCLRGASPFPMACLRLTKYPSVEHIVAESVSQNGEHEPLKVTPIRRIFKVSEPIDLRISAAPDAVVFEVNGIEARKQSIGTKPIAYYFGCSSVVCRIDLYDSQAR